MATNHMKSLSTTELRLHLGKILSDLTRNRKPIFVERGGEAIAVLLSVSEYQRMKDRNGGTQPEAGRALALQAFGMWAERVDLDEWLNAGRARWRSEWQNDLLPLIQLL